MTKKISPIILFVFAVIIYAAFSGWLFWSILTKFTNAQKAFLVIPTIAAAGTFLLSRRYVNSFVACFIAGLIYGFGAFASAFFCYHPAAGLIYACLPWVFIPAVFLNKWIQTNDKVLNLLSAILSLLPFIFIIATFSIAAAPRYRLIPIPTGTVVSTDTLTGLFSPINIKPDVFSVGFYHAPLSALAVGLILFFKTRRFWITAIFAVSVLLAFQEPLLNVPPVFWLSLPVLICSVIIAEGLEAFILAGRADANWLLLAAAVLILQAALNAALSDGSNLPLSTALSGLALIAVLFIFFIARAGLAVHYPRMLALYSVVSLDIIIVTKNIINAIF